MCIFTASVEAETHHNSIHAKEYLNAIDYAEKMYEIYKQEDSKGE